MALKVFHFLILVFACSAANAQVYKCTDPGTKKITYSDAPCIDGRKIERRRSEEERMLDAERASESRSRFTKEARDDGHQKQQRRYPPSQDLTPIEVVSRYECERAQKNAWGSNKEQAQRKADILCYGPEKAAKLQIAQDQSATQEASEDSAPKHAKGTHPTIITKCRGKFCVDNNGGNYFRQNDKFMTSTDGRPCFRQGKSWNCN